MSYDQQIRESRVLILDDAVANIALLESVLRRLGFKQVRSLSDSREVFTAMADWPPDLLILDLSMPHVSGFEVLELLRGENAGTEGMPVLVLTGEVEPAVKRKALALGASEFVLRPFDTSEIVLRIRNLLMMRFLQKEMKRQNRDLELKVAERTSSLLERSQQLETALEKLNQSQDQLLEQERLRAFAGMAGGIAHDFNNVLNCVVGYTDLLLADEKIAADPASVVEFAQIMNTAGRDAAKMVNRLRDLYRPRENTEAWTPTHVPTLLAEAVSFSRPKWKAQALAAGRTIEVVVEAGEVPEISCNAAEVREALMNLIFNAVDAMPAGGTITLRARAAGECVELGVADVGTGMSPEVRTRCLEPFFSTKGEQGTGLGLAMVFGILKRHEGTIHIESALGEGTTIWLRLPRRIQPSAPEPRPQPTGEKRRLNVLVVDDQPIARDIVSRYLKADGHRVTASGNGQEALTRIMGEAFDLVVTDHAMPLMTGTDLALAIKGRPAPPRVVLLSGTAEADFAGHPPDSIDAWLSKPATGDELRQAVARAMARRAAPEYEEALHA
jgi:signal transduction histidine kinase